MKSTPMRRGNGIECVDGNKGTAVPICLKDFKRSYCGCSGSYEKDSCPYRWRMENGVCRNSAIIKCCVEECYTYLDVVILVDSSGSVKAENFEIQKKFVADLVRSFKIGENYTRVSIINFSQNATVVNKLKEGIDKEKVAEYAENLEFKKCKYFLILN